MSKWGRPSYSLINNHTMLDIEIRAMVGIALTFKDSGIVSAGLWLPLLNGFLWSIADPLRELNG